MCLASAESAVAAPEPSQVRASVAKAVLYGPVAKTGYKWNGASSELVHHQTKAMSEAARKTGSIIRMTNGSSALFAGNSEGLNAVAKGSAYKWGLRSSVDQSAYKWGLRSSADQSAYKWGLRSSVDQSAYKWGLRSSADQSAYKWGLRSSADQSAYKWGLRSSAGQSAYKWGLR